MCENENECVCVCVWVHGRRLLGMGSEIFCLILS